MPASLIGYPDWRPHCWVADEQPLASDVGPFPRQRAGVGSEVQGDGVPLLQFLESGQHRLC